MKNNIITKITEKHGEDILLDSKKLSGLIADYIPGDIKTKNLFDNAVKAGIPKKLHDMKSADPTDRAKKIKGLCINFMNDYSIAETAAYKTVNCFADAFGFEETEIPSAVVQKPGPVKPKKNPADSFLRKISANMRLKLRAKWENRRKLGEIENIGYKSIFWIITLVIAFSICIVTFSSVTPRVLDFILTLEFVSAGIIYNSVYYTVLLAPYLLFASGMGAVIIYNKKAMKFRDISARHCVISGFYCILGHFMTALFVTAVFLLVRASAAIIPQEMLLSTEIPLYLIMPGILTIGALSWLIRIFINKKIAGFITLTVLLLVAFGIYNGWFNRLIDILPKP